MHLVLSALGEKNNYYVIINQNNDAGQILLRFVTLHLRLSKVLKFVDYLFKHYTQV